MIRKRVNIVSLSFTVITFIEGTIHILLSLHKCTELFKCIKSAPQRVFQDMGSGKIRDRALFLNKLRRQTSACCFTCDKQNAKC